MPGLRDLPEAKGERHVKAFCRCGWKETRSSGSHRILEKDGEEAILSIPCSGKNVKRTLLHSQIKLARLTIKEYIAVFR
jgi:predicted RNA binding protein YcfA (HicA-like mRNA interferase family)